MKKTKKPKLLPAKQLIRKLFPKAVVKAVEKELK
jgi:hypothetical protein